MADLNFTACDDSPYVRDAMYRLGILCGFADLSPDQMSLILGVADYLKRVEEERKQPL